MDEQIKDNKNATCTDCEQGVRKTVRSDKEKHYLAGRLNRIAGQINGVKRMIEDDRYCEDVLTQLSAVNSAVESVSVYIMEQHMKGCIVRDIKSGKDEAADEILTLFKRFMR